MNEIKLETLFEKAKTTNVQKKHFISEKNRNRHRITKIARDERNKKIKKYDKKEKAKEKLRIIFLCGHFTKSDAKKLINNVYE